MRDDRGDSRPWLMGSTTSQAPLDVGRERRPKSPEGSRRLPGRGGSRSWPRGSRRADLDRGESVGRLAAHVAAGGGFPNRLDQAMDAAASRADELRPRAMRRVFGLAPLPYSAPGQGMRRHGLPTRSGRAGRLYAASLSSGELAPGKLILIPARGVWRACSMTALRSMRCRRE